MIRTCYRPPYGGRAGSVRRIPSAGRDGADARPSALRRTDRQRPARAEAEDRGGDPLRHVLAAGLRAGMGRGPPTGGGGGPAGEPKLRTAEVIHSDMSWRRVSVLAWAVHRNGWAVLIRWPDGREDWRGYDRRDIRPGLSLVVGGSGQLDRSRRHAGACSVRTGARVVSAVGTAGGPSGSRWGSSRSSQGGIHQLRRPSRNMVAGRSPGAGRGAATDPTGARRPAR